MDGLARRHIRSPVGAPDQIDVRVITHADGSRAYIVDLPGTKAWNLPGGVDTALNDAGTNVHAMGGDVTTRQKAIAEALHLAGANSTDPVMLIGHSQGGIVAAQIAQAAGTSDFNYNVTHVVTAGAPIARIDIPNNVQVLALENSHDIVPHLDAADNPDRPNLTTVTFDNQQGTIVGDHSIEQVYVPAAQALDTSTDPSVTAYRDSAGAFLSAAGDGTTVQANVYNLSRVP
jgi:pimeloyl-ACP methyl ester carboxylesterase